MRRLHRPAALVAGTLAIACIAVPAQPIASAASAAGTVKLRLTGLNRDSQVVAVPQASLLGLRHGAEYLYQGSPLAVRVGTYLIAAEVPAFSGTVQTSDTLVFAKETVGRAETIRLDGRGGRKLNVSLTGVSATPELLIADVCMSRYPGYGGDMAGSAFGGPGVAVYAVPVKSRYITFEYGDALTSAAGATYYLTGSAATGKIPARLSYVQRASGLAKLTMALRSGAYGSSEFFWSIESGNSQSLYGGAGQNVPVTDARYDPLGLNSANQAPAGGTSVLNVTIARPGNAGIPTPVYRLKAVRFYASFNDGASWQSLKALRHGSAWRVTIADPSSGYVAIRSIVTDVRGDSTEQTVYRAYGVTGP